MEFEKIKKEELEASKKENLEKSLKQQEKTENPQFLIEDAIKNIEQINELGISAEVAKQALRDILETIQEEDDTTKEEQGFNLFVAYQGIKETEQYVNLDEEFGLSEIKNSLAKELGERFGIDLGGETEIGEMVNLDQKLEAMEKSLKEFSLLKEKDISLEEITKHQQQFEQYSKLKQGIKRKQQAILGEQESFYKQYAEKISNGFGSIGKKIDSWALGKKLVNFVGEHRIASRTMKTAAVGIIAFGAIGGIFNPDSSEASEVENTKEAEDDDKIEVKIGAEHVYDKAEKAGEKDLVEAARVSCIEDAWYEYNNRWIDTGGTVVANSVEVPDSDEENHYLEKIGVNEPNPEDREVSHYHIHPMSLATFQFFDKCEGIVPIPPSASDLNFYSKQEGLMEEKGMEFEGRVADPTGIWKVKQIDQEKISEVLMEKMRSGEVNTFDDIYKSLFDKFMGKDFKMENIDLFIEAVKLIGIDLEYEVVHEDDLKNRKEGLKRLAQEHFKANGLTKDSLPPVIYNQYFKNIFN